MLKKISRKLALYFLPFVGSLLIKFLYMTNKKVFNAPASLPDENFIIACWHGELLMVPYVYFKYRKTSHAKIIISEHFDGTLIAKTVSYFGFGAIRGSSRRNAARALLQGIKVLKEGYDLGITPDGPKGPRHEVADGIIIMAQKADVKITLVHCKPTSYWQLNSWDKFVIPKPFGTITYYVSDLIDVQGLELEEARSVIKKELLKT